MLSRMRRSGAVRDGKPHSVAAAVLAGTVNLELMIAHHQGAIAMANEVITAGRDADVRSLARNVVGTQTAEIQTMRALLDQDPA